MVVGYCEGWAGVVVFNLRSYHYCSFYNFRWNVVVVAMYEDVGLWWWCWIGKSWIVQNSYTIHRNTGKSVSETDCDGCFFFLSLSRSWSFCRLSRPRKRQEEESRCVSTGSTDDERLELKRTLFYHHARECKSLIGRARATNFLPPTLTQIQQPSFFFSVNL